MSRNQRNPLQLYVGESDRAERHATWLELFFDLVFVFAISQLAHFLHLCFGVETLGFTDGRKRQPPYNVYSLKHSRYTYNIQRDNYVFDSKESILLDSLRLNTKP